MNVLVPIADGTEEIEAVTIIDTLKRAGANITVASVMPTNSITASRGVKITADSLIQNCTDIQFDLIALPGGMPGAEHLANSKHLIDMLKAQKQKNKAFAAICASPAIVLAQTLSSMTKKATCYPSMLKRLPNPIDKPVVEDNNCITSQGPATALKFSLALVKKLFGNEKYNKIANEMLAF